MAEDEVVGTAVIRVVIDRTGAERDIDETVRDYDRRTTTGSRTTGERAGKAYSDAFNKAVRTRLASAISALPKGEIDLDDTSAMGKLVAIRATMEGLGEERLGIKLDDREVYANLRVLEGQLRELSTNDVDVHVRTNALAALAEIEALKKAVGDVDPKPPKETTAAKIGRDAEAAVKEFGFLRVAIEQLGPPLIPIAGGALGFASAFVGLGAAGIAAVKGISAEYKAGTPLGQQYGGMLKTLKSDAAELEHTAAGGVITGFNEALAKAQIQLPAVNAEIATSSRNLGDITSHLVGGVLGGFSTFTPLINQAEGSVNKLATRFEEWATGPGGEHFAATLSDDLNHLGPALENIVTLGVHLVDAFHPVGTVMLDSLSLLAHTIDEIPVGVLQTGATAYIAFRTAVAVTSVLDLATKSLTRLAGAEAAAAAGAVDLAAAEGAAGAAGAAGGAAARAEGAAARGGFLSRSAGGLALVTSRLVPYAAAWIGASIAVNAAANATDKWRHSTDTAKSLIGSVSHFLSETLSLHPIKAFEDLAADVSAHNLAATQQATAQNLINAAGAGPGRSWYAPNGTQFVPGLNSGVETPESLARQRQFGGPAYTTSIAGARRELAGYSATLASARTRARELNAAQEELVASNQQGTVAWLRNQEAIDANNRVGERASRNYTQTAQSIKLYTASLRESQRVQNSTRDRYATQQGDVLGALQRNTFAQNPTLSAGVAGLQGYSKAVNAAIKSEESWTKVTDDNIVSIRGHTYETKAFNAELVKTGGDVDKAIGLLLGHTHALANDKVAAQGAAEMQARLSGDIGAAEDKYKLNDTQLNIYAATLGITSEQLATGSITQRQFVADVGEVKNVIDEADTSTAGWVTALGNFEAQIAKTGDTAAARAQLMAAAMVSLNGTAISYGVTAATAADANQKFVNDFDAMSKSVINLKTGFIDYHNAGALPVLSDLQSLQTAAANMAAATYQDEVSTKGRTRAAKDAAKVYYNDTHKALISEANQLHLTHDQAEKLANRYFHWPKNAITRIEAMGVDGTNKLLSGIGEQLAILTGRPWISTLDADPVSAEGKIADLQARIDAIRQNKVPGLDADSQRAKDKIAALQRQIDNLRGKTLYINTDIVNRAGTLPGPGGDRIPVARGGIVQYDRGGMYQPDVYRAKPGTVRVFAEPGTEWEAYIPGANDGRRPRAKAVAAEAVRRLGGYAQFEQGGFSGVTSGSSSGSGGSGSGSTASTSKVTSAISSLFSALSGSIRDVAKAELQLERAVAKFPANSSTVTWLKNEDKHLRNEVETRNRINGELTRARNYLKNELQLWGNLKSTTSGAITGAFDVSSAGTGYNGQQKVSFANILAEATQDKNQVDAFRRGIEKLLREGMNKQYVMELAAKGPAALPQVQALASATPKQLAQLNRVEVSVQGEARRTSREVANYVYGEGVATARALINGFNPKNRKLAHEVQALSNSLFGVGKVSARSLAHGLASESKTMNAAVNTLAHNIVKSLKHRLGIASPSKVTAEIGMNTGLGVAVGMESSIARVHVASGRVGDAAVRHLGGGRGRPHRALGHDPRVDALIDAMAGWFAHPPEIRTADGQVLGKLVAHDNNVLARVQ